MEYLLKKEIIAPIVIIIICFLLCVISKKIICKLLGFKTQKIKAGKQKTITNLISNIVICILVAIAILTILEIYGINTKSLIASLGVIGLVAGLAIQDILKDFIAGISFVIEGQFSMGDWITVNGFKGEVISSGLRTTKLKAYTGEVKIISNRNITEVVNHSMSSANLIVDVGVSYESDIEKVGNILDNLCIALKDKYKLKDISCLGVQELSSSSINFRILVSTTYDKQFEIDRNIKKEILLCFKQHKLTIPYNQVVIHNG